MNVWANKNRFLRVLGMIIGFSFIQLCSQAREIHIPKNQEGSWYKPRIPKIRPGDTIILKGNYGYWYLENIRGTADSPVVFRNKNGQSRVGTANHYAAVFMNCAHFIIDGTGDSTFKYGIVFGPAEPPYISQGLTPYNSTDYEIKNIEIMNTQVGIFGNPDKGPPMMHIRIHNNYVHDLDNPLEGGRSEGIYLGNTNIFTVSSPAHFEDIKIYDNLFENLSGDGIQLCNAQGYEVYGNTVRNYGKANIDYQRTGILMGGNTSGILRDNVIENGTGAGIQIFGYGTNIIKNNVLKNTARSANEDGIYIEKKGIDGAPLKVDCINNTITGAARFGIRNACTKATGRAGKWSGNKITKTKFPAYQTEIGDIISGKK